MNEINILYFSLLYTFANCDDSHGIHHRVYHNKRIDKRYIFSSTEAPSMMTCAMYCATVTTCWAANYNNISEVCQMSSASPRTHPNVIVDDPGWIILHRKDKCYEDWTVGNNSCLWLADKNLSWTGARNYCRNLNSSLVEIYDADKNDQLKALYLQQTRMSNNSLVQDNYFWIGGRGIGNNFFWDSTNNPMNYTNWYSGDGPYNVTGVNYEIYCVEMSQIKQFSWSYIKCDQNMTFVCERQFN